MWGMISLTWVTSVDVIHIQSIFQRVRRWTTDCHWFVISTFLLPKSWFFSNKLFPLVEENYTNQTPFHAAKMLLIQLAIFTTSGSAFPSERALIGKHTHQNIIIIHGQGGWLGSSMW